MVLLLQKAVTRLILLSSHAKCCQLQRFLRGEIQAVCKTSCVAVSASPAVTLILDTSSVTIPVRPSYITLVCSTTFRMYPSPLKSRRHLKVTLPAEFFEVLRDSGTFILTSLCNLGKATSVMCCWRLWGNEAPFCFRYITEAFVLYSTETVQILANEMKNKVMFCLILFFIFFLLHNLRLA